ncbi:hypothetical protein EW026_g3852 [Hermanssonia centrifuga]|uniref:Uncharacterized protein n=1 Tax=Hermanssonia centrifuga TaxID=98765 RepID=A0A4S4KJD8_9APHY|nr:hypothetical protein EW026_g3852 [Hermanssonia centrifuga]
MTPPNGRRTWTTHSGPLVRHTKTLPSERDGVPVRKEDVSDDKFPDVRVVIAESVKAHKAAAAAAAEREREAIEYIVISDTEVVEKPRSKAKGNNVGPARPCKKTVKRCRSDVNEAGYVETSDVEKDIMNIAGFSGRTLHNPKKKKYGVGGSAAHEDLETANALSTQDVPTIGQAMTSTSITMMRPMTVSYNR